MINKKKLEAHYTALWIKSFRLHYWEDVFIWNIPDIGNKEKVIDVLIACKWLFLAIEFKYDKNKLSIEKLTKLLQLNQILTIRKYMINWWAGILWQFYPGWLDLYLYQSDGWRKQIRSDIGSFMKDIGKSW